MKDDVNKFQLLVLFNVIVGITDKVINDAEPSYGIKKNTYDDYVTELVKMKKVDYYTDRRRHFSITLDTMHGIVMQENNQRDDILTRHNFTNYDDMNYVKECARGCATKFVKNCSNDIKCEERFFEHVANLI